MMIELTTGTEHLPLQLASRVLMAPGVWAPDSRLSLAGLGALVTPPLGWEWDGEAAAWEAHVGGFSWTPPRRPLERFLRRLGRERDTLPRIITLAPDRPQAMERAVREAEVEGAAGYLLWDATPEVLAGARRGGLALPLLAEVPSNEAGEKATALVEAGADALWIGAPRVRGTRLWGPAVLPLVLAALEDERARAAGVPLIAGAGIGSAADALRLREAGAEAVALDPASWVQPSLANEVAEALSS
jgi:hypothetical protein